MQECSRCGCSGRWEGLADARREAAAAASLGCGEMAGAADVPPRSSRTHPLGCSQQEDKEGFEKINTRPGKVQGAWRGRAGLASWGIVRCDTVAPLHCVTPSQIILFSEAGFVGQKREIWGDVPDATSWELSHTISIRVIRGG